MQKEAVIGLFLRDIYLYGYNTLVPTYDAIVFFCSALTDRGEVPAFAKPAIERAVELVRQGKAPRLIICGSHPLKIGPRRRKECDVYATYVEARNPELTVAIKKESESTSIPENWLYLKLCFPELKRIKLVTYKLLLPRVKFFGHKIYGKSARLSFETVSATSGLFAHEVRFLRDAKCILKNMRPGQHSFIEKPGWDALRRAHHSCPIHPRNK